MKRGEGEESWCKLAASMRSDESARGLGKDMVKEKDGGREVIRFGSLRAKYRPRTKRRAGPTPREARGGLVESNNNRLTYEFYYRRKKKVKRAR